MSELKPCPFCGSEAKLNYVRGNERYNQSWNVRCTSCECVSKAYIGSNSWEQGKEPRKLDKKMEQYAVDWWNRRTP